MTSSLAEISLKVSPEQKNVLCSSGVLQVPAYYGISGNFVTVYVRAEKDSYARRSIYVCRGGESVDVLI